MKNTKSSKIGIYVDVSNMHHNGGGSMRYKVLRQFACRDGGDAMRLNAYIPYDKERAAEDDAYRNKRQNYFSVMRDCGFKVIQKLVRWYYDEDGTRHSKANADLDMAVDILLQSYYLDQVLLVTGDGDFVQVVRAMQNNGCRVEVLAFDNVSAELMREADMFMSGYLVPNLLPFGSGSDNHERWGKPGSRVRGHCYHYDNVKSFGFLRFLPEIAPGLWNTDTRDFDSPYDTAFFHNSELPHGFNRPLPSRKTIFEFTLEKPLNDEEGQKLRAVRLTEV